MPASTHSPRPRLTVAILARDAEHLLIDTLDTAAQLADEIVVCDTGSTDGTRELVRQHGARLIEHSWGNSFAEARNAAWAAATGEWILWLDAGERIVTDGQGKLAPGSKVDIKDESGGKGAGKGVEKGAEKGVEKGAEPAAAPAKGGGTP